MNRSSFDEMLGLIEEFVCCGDPECEYTEQYKWLSGIDEIERETLLQFVALIALRINEHD